MVAAPEVDWDLDTLFELGLERRLDGYAALIQTGSSRLTYDALQPRSVRTIA